MLLKLKNNMQVIKKKTDKFCLSCSLVAAVAAATTAAAVAATVATIEA